MPYTYYWNQEFRNNTAKMQKSALCIEIGCFEGLTSNYICDNLLSDGGLLVCVDPLTDNYFNQHLTDVAIADNGTIYKYYERQYARFVENAGHQIHTGKLRLVRDTSENAYPGLIAQYAGQAGLIYIDGDHRAFAVYADAVACFELCKTGGVIIFAV